MYERERFVRRENLRRRRLVNITHLHRAIRKLHHHGRLRSEPLMHVRYSRESVALLHRDGAACLHQVLVHVLEEEVHQLHLLLEMLRELLDRIVHLLAIAIDVVYVEAVGQHDQARAVVVHHADPVVGQLIPEAVLVRVVHPLADPDHGLRRRIGQLVRDFYEKQNICAL